MDVFHNFSVRIKYKKLEIVKDNDNDNDTIKKNDNNWNGGIYGIHLDKDLFFR